MKKSFDDFGKNDWLEANTVGEIPESTDIYRIFRVDHLLNDLKNGTNTLVNPCYETQKDSLENPLKQADYTIDGKKHQLFNSLMGEYFTQSWSLERLHWGAFGDGKDTIRIKCNARALFDRLMDNGHPQYYLYYYMGLIDYEDAGEIREAIERSCYQELVLLGGYALLRSVLKLISNHHKEKEVRLVYIRSPRRGYSWPDKHPVLGNLGHYCSHQFSWRNLIKSYELNPANRCSGDEIAGLIDTLR